MIEELDLIIAAVDINSEVPKNTVGVVLSVSKDGMKYLIEFLDSQNETIGNGMTLVEKDQVKLFKKVNY
jgi:hypothetical protein